METLHFYFLAARVSRLIAELTEKQCRLLDVFPINTTHADARHYQLRFAEVNQLHRLLYLAGMIPQYWNASRKCPGPEFNFKTWKEMMNYGYKHPVKPPVPFPQTIPFANMHH